MSEHHEEPVKPNRFTRFMSGLIFEDVEDFRKLETTNILLYDIRLGVGLILLVETFRAIV